MFIYVSAFKPFCKIAQCSAKLSCSLVAVDLERQSFRTKQFLNDEEHRRDGDLGYRYLLLFTLPPPPFFLCAVILGRCKSTLLIGGARDCELLGVRLLRDRLRWHISSDTRVLEHVWVRCERLEVERLSQSSVTKKGWILDRFDLDPWLTSRVSSMDMVGRNPWRMF